ncbi:MAG: Gfo/Idh/MocA family oxidoreductase [Clostridiaceae bacterium]|nr:Gfo/Idh/MocA family oxidoreductase [Eubacteriales bacterium]
MRIGTVGTNFVVRSFLDAARKAGAEIAAVYSRREETARAFAEANGVTRTCCDREAFLSDGALDAIYVASPNSEHFAWAYEALKHGRHVICEKPFVSTARELDELCALAKQKGLLLFEAITVPHLPNLKLIKEHLFEIGAPRLAQLNFSQYSSRYDAFLRGEVPNAFSPAFSGGALMDLGCYNLRFLLELFGEPEELRYFPNRAINGIDTSGVMVARYPGLVCTAASCKDSKSRNLIQIQGEKGYIVIPSVSSTLSEGFTVVTKEGEREYQAQSEENVLYYEMKAFVRAFEENDLAFRDALLEKSRAETRLIEAARLSAGIVFKADGV